jgi:hypothetical protein
MDSRYGFRMKTPSIVLRFTGTIYEFGKLSFETCQKGKEEKAMSIQTLEEILKEKSKFGRDYISAISRGSIPPENLEEIIKQSEVRISPEESLRRGRHKSSRIYAQLMIQLEAQSEAQGPSPELLKDEILGQPMISQYRSLMKELKDKRTRGIVSMFG